MACKRSAVRSRLPPPKRRSPSSRGLGHRPFTAVTGVRIPVGTPAFSGSSARKGSEKSGPFLFPEPRKLRPGSSTIRGAGRHGFDHRAGTFDVVRETALAVPAADAGIDDGGRHDRSARNVRSPHPIRLQRGPVELDAVPRSVRCDRHAVAQVERLCDEAIEAESVDFQIGPVGHGREQVHVDIVGAVHVLGVGGPRPGARSSSTA